MLFGAGGSMQRPALLVLLFALLPALFTTDGHTKGSHAFYSVAPGTPLCSPGDPIICAWSTDGLTPAPVKYAVEAIAGYDPDCRNGADFSAEFSFTTADANPLIAFAAGALDKIECTSNDDPCSAPRTYHAASVAAR